MKKTIEQVRVTSMEASGTQYTDEVQLRRLTGCWLRLRDARPQERRTLHADVVEVLAEYEKAHAAYLAAATTHVEALKALIAEREG